jgi:hypothetical protein
LLTGDCGSCWRAAVHPITGIQRVADNARLPAVMDASGRFALRLGCRVRSGELAARRGDSYRYRMASADGDESY